MTKELKQRSRWGFFSGIRQEIGEPAQSMAIWQHIDPRLRWALLAAGVIVLVRLVAVDFFAWQAEKRVRIAALRRTVEHKMVVRANRSVIEEAYRRSTEAYDGVAGRFYRGVEAQNTLQLRLQQEMERVAKASGLRIERIDWERAPEAKGGAKGGGPDAVMQAPIKIRAEGDLDQVARFLSAVEGYKTFLTVDLLRLQARPGAQRLLIELAITAYGVPK